MHHKKIAIFSPGLNIGGIEKVFLNYASLLSKNYNVSFVTCYENADLINLIPSSVNVVNFRTNKLSRSLFHIISFLRKERPNYILTANAATIIIVLAKILAFSKVRILASHHNYINQEIHSFRDSFILYRIYNFCWNVIAVSEGIKKHLIDQGVNPRKIQLINNPINIREINFKLSDDSFFITTPYILFVGRLSVVKNLFFLIRSFQILTKNNDHIKLIIVGDGPEKGRLENEILKLNLQNKVILTGALENPYPLISKSSLIVLPSYSEAYPTILLESLYLGKTIVATPTIGALDILCNGNLGYISTSFDNKQEFASLLEKGISSSYDSKFLKEKFNLLYNPKIAICKIIELLD